MLNRQVIWRLVRERDAVLHERIKEMAAFAAAGKGSSFRIEFELAMNEREFLLELMRAVVADFERRSPSAAAR